MPAKPQNREEADVLTALPRMFSVILHNDDYTTMDFVVEILMRVFRKPAQEAAQMMMRVHEENACIVGVYTYDIAVTKKAQADAMAEQHGFPLKITVAEAQA